MSDDWPVDENDTPMARVNIHIEEKIGLPNYSNISISGSITKFCKDTPNNRKATMKKLASEVEEILAEERGRIVEDTTKFIDER